MNNLNIYLFSVLIFEISLLFLPVSGSYYQDSSVSRSNIYTAEAQFSGISGISGVTGPSGESGPTGESGATGPSGQQKIIINELFEAGSSNNLEWVELYNPNTANQDVSGWTIKDSSADSPDVFPEAVVIPAYGYALIITNHSVVSLPSGVTEIRLSNNTIGNGLNDPGDSLILSNNTGSIIDQMSYGNVSTVISPPPPAPGDTQSLARIPNGIDSDSASDWVLDSSPTMGGENSL